MVTVDLAQGEVVVDWRSGLLIHFDAVTLFPEMFDAITRSGVTRRAFENAVYELVLWNPRDFSSNAYRSVDDRPYGGGPGMVMLPEPLEQRAEGRAPAAEKQRCARAAAWCTSARRADRSRMHAQAN